MDKRARGDLNPGPTASVISILKEYNNGLSEEKLKEAEEKIKKALRPPIEKVMQEWALRPLEIPRSILDVAGLSEDEVIDVSDLNDFRAWLKDQNKSPVTQREYPRLLRRSFKHINKPITLSKIKE
ncbi:MAG: hypothetical protein QXD42_01835, partial [Nitrososphaerales archaeon]